MWVNDISFENINIKSPHGGLLSILESEYFQPSTYTFLFLTFSNLNHNKFNNVPIVVLSKMPNLIKL